jgi:endonuclease YncB( thermonuclease family)
MFRLLLAIIFVAISAIAIFTVFDGDCGTTLCCEDCKTLAVTGIIDGDTFDSDEGRIRLYGLDTPEAGVQCYEEATDRLRELAGDLVRVEPGPRGQDQFGRSLYYVYTSSGDSIDELLVKEGFAWAWTQDGQYRDHLIELESKARQDGTGCLW